MARPFIKICAPIYNGVSRCSTFAHQKLTTSTTNISRTREKSSRASWTSASIQFDTKQGSAVWPRPLELRGAGMGQAR